MILNVAGAFHSSLMKSAADKLEKMLAGIAFKAPQVPVVSNVTGRPHGNPDETRQVMVRQVTSPVQWIGTVGWFQADGVKEYVECGPGKVLAGLIKRIDKAAATHSIQDTATVKACVAARKAPPPAT